jgi:hypothetical protein
MYFKNDENGHVLGSVAGPRMHSTKKVSVNASATLAALLGAALPANVVGVAVYNEGTLAVRYQTTGAAADANCAGIPIGGNLPFLGSKADLDNVRLFTGSASAVSLTVYQR